MMIIEVYGVETGCASCVPGPSSQETASWLTAFMNRHYGDEIIVRYIDANAPQDERQAELVKRMKQDKWWYPVIVMDQEMIAEGTPHAKLIHQKMAEKGIASLDHKKTRTSE